jgi:hypothetical protein
MDSIHSKEMNHPAGRTNLKKKTIIITLLIHRTRVNYIYIFNTRSIRYVCEASPVCMTCYVTTSYRIYYRSRIVIFHDAAL